MTLSRIGGLAALICAATYLVGFALLAVQALLNLIRLPFVEAPVFRVEEMHK